MPVNSRHCMKLWCAVAAILALGFLSACQPAGPTASAGPTVPAGPTESAGSTAPAGTTAPAPIDGAYPGASSQPADQANPVIPAEGYPAAQDPQNPPGLSGVPVIDNRSQITAQLISQSPDEANQNYLVLRVKILTTQEIAGMPSFTQGKENQEIDLYIEKTLMPEIQPGDTLDGEVLYRGDERGGKYFLAKINNITN